MEFKDFTIEVKDITFHIANVIINHPKMEYIGIVSITNISACPGLLKYHSSGKQDSPTISLSRGILFHSSAMGFNTCDYMFTAVQKDLVFVIFGVMFSIVVSDDKLTITLKDIDNVISSKNIVHKM